MGAEEGAAGPGVVTAGAPKHVRHDRPRSPTTLECGSMARDIPISKRRFRVVQPDGGPPQKKVHASSRPQGRIFHG